MNSFSYSLTPILKENLQMIDYLRTQILLAHLSTKAELKLRFESNVARIYWSLNMSEQSLTKTDVEKILTSSLLLNKRKSTRHIPQEKAVILYKYALDYIYSNWYVTKLPFKLKNLLELSEILKAKPSKEKFEDLSKALDFINESSSSPIIKAANAQMLIVQTKPFEDMNGRIARLISLVYLYKYGYDFRGLLQLEEFWRRDISSLEVIDITTTRTGSLNNWLEYYTQGMITQLNKTIEKIKMHSFAPLDPGFWDLSERQKQILDYLTFPQATITNRKVQNHFNISQVTASRDLAKLLSLNLIAPHGKGRSIYYTRV